jgi:predicted DNA-binding transcriptional regulator YafY
VESQPWHFSQIVKKQTDSQIDVELFLCITRELKMQILSYGDDVEVIQPKSLRLEVQALLKSALAKYK